jgi:hypothetical protein
VQLLRVRAGGRRLAPLPVSLGSAWRRCSRLLPESFVPFEAQAASGDLGDVLYAGDHQPTLQSPPSQRVMQPHPQWVGRPRHGQSTYHRRRRQQGLGRLIAVEFGVASLCEAMFEAGDVSAETPPMRCGQVGDVLAGLLSRLDPGEATAQPCSSPSLSSASLASSMAAAGPS